MQNIFYNAHHAPVGAFASFTLGFPGASGGLGLELGRPANQNVYIGAESADRSCYELFPFYQAETSHESERYEADAANAKPTGVHLESFARDKIRRDFQLGTDTWSAGDIDFRIYTHSPEIPDPRTTTAAEMRRALVPAVLCELSVDNTKGDSPRRAFFGFQGDDPCSAMRLLETGAVRGVGQGRHIAIAASASDVQCGLGFSLTDILEERPENYDFGLGVVGALLMNVPAGERRTFRFAACFYRAGVVTSGMDCSYFYTHLFSDIEDVAAYALEHTDEMIGASENANALLAHSSLSDDQRFMLAHAIHSYYGNTEMLDRDGEALWIVNEGEYRMMNTFDLTVDHLFFELKKNPWVVCNVLDQFVDSYSYRDETHFPGAAARYPGGLSFTHDMGIANVFSRPGRSCYEKSGLTGCFSHMTHEQLVNWLCCAATYVEYTDDQIWLLRRFPIFEECLQSLLNRDHPDPEQRNGLMGLDSSRTGNGAEITTYDSLDESLGQARNNVYMGVKTWAAYVALERLFETQGRADLARSAGEQADRCARTIARSMDDGYIPAVISEGNTARIIPAIEGLVFPFVSGNRSALDPQGRYRALIGALKDHFENVLQPGICLFPEGGWKLSSTSDNSWLSKTYLAQHVARSVLGLDSAAITADADAAHVKWLLHPELSYWAWSDQMIAGRAMASRYYPRGVTAILWLNEERPAAEMLQR
ncbi:MAG: glycoside hydrolase family 52 protein [Capsulimonas sp.]|uniref:glycoside hydrolase family 52 protein n=1 Tax=Capsulimonas sp. TaxID=2494211 RepID=UPI0032667DA0